MRQLGWFYQALLPSSRLPFPRQNPFRFSSSCSAKKTAMLNAERREKQLPSSSKSLLSRRSPPNAHKPESLRVSCFDICGEVPSRKNVPLLTERGTGTQELEHSKNYHHVHELESGMFLLKDYVSLSDQIEVIKNCRELGLGPGGFYQPGYSSGAKLRLQMMCLGKIWDPERLYRDRFRTIDGAKAPSIPSDFKHLVDRAIETSHSFLKQNTKLRSADDILPRMTPDICIVNFYMQSGRLGLHQDRDESTESIRRGLPVVSFSIGDSAEFLYGFEKDVNKANKVILESGDVLIFGGESRLIFHGVSCILPNTAPWCLLEETNLCPGRLNLTFRQY